jgi:glutathione synthase/RimK-type ligase-like ATP-grasp enzyme
MLYPRIILVFLSTTKSPELNIIEVRWRIVAPKKSYQQSYIYKRIRDRKAVIVIGPKKYNIAHRRRINDILHI